MRYRLRTLLILLSLVCCGLGIVAWIRQSSLYVPESCAEVGFVRSGTGGTSVFNVTNRGFKAVKIWNDDCDQDAQFAYHEGVTMAPGESHRVIVSWTAPESGSLLKRFRIRTNDPRKPVLDFSVVGRVE